MPGMTSFGMWHFNIPSLKYKVIQYCTETSNGERENKAFDIEARFYRQIKKGWRMPIFRHEQRLCKSKGHRYPTHFEHLFPRILFKEVNRRPKGKEDKRPNEPYVLHLFLNLCIIKCSYTGPYKPPQNESLDNPKKSFH